MASSWTDRLQSVSISSLVKMNITGISEDCMIDGTFAEAPPGYLFKGVEKQALAYDNAALYQLCYMSAECDCYMDYLSKDGLKAVRGQHVLGTINFTVLDTTGRPLKYCVPLLFVSSSRVRNSKFNSEHRPMVNGLFCGQALVVACQDSPEETKRTFRHEVVHAMVAALPDLRQTMYGGDVAAQTEEIVTHIVTDKLSVLQHINDLKFVQTVTNLPCSKGRVSQGYSMDQYAVTDICDEHGKSLIKQTFDLDVRSSSKKLDEYLHSRKEFYRL